MDSNPVRLLLKARPWWKLLWYGRVVSDATFNETLTGKSWTLKAFCLSSVMMAVVVKRQKVASARTQSHCFYENFNNMLKAFHFKHWVLLGLLSFCFFSNDIGGSTQNKNLLSPTIEPRTSIKKPLSEKLNSIQNSNPNLWVVNIPLWPLDPYLPMAINAQSFFGVKSSQS